MTHLIEQASRTILVLHVGTMHDHGEDQPQRVDSKVPFASADLFASVVAPLAANFRGPHALAVENRGAGRGLPTLGATHLLAEHVVNRLPHAVQPPVPEQIVNRLPIRKVARQLPPLTTGAVHIKNRIDDLPTTDLAWPPDATGRWQQGAD